jgi:hypothetical protein
MKIFQWFFIGLLCLTFVAITGHSSAQNRSVATQNAVSTAEVAAQMDLVPTNCGILAAPIQLNAQQGYFIGSWPILIGIPNYPNRYKGVMGFPNEHLHSDNRLPGWWATKMAWFVSESYVGVVKVRGFNIKDNSPIYINWKGDNPVTTAEFDPSKTISYVDGMTGWAFFPSHVWVSKAGCYRLEAEWDGGAWHQIVAVGYIPNP